MSDTENSLQKIPGQTWAVRLGAALLLGYAAVAVFAAVEKSHRANLEHLDEPTAVGDTVFFPLPKPWDVEKALALLDRKPLYFTDWVSVPDSMMLKSGRADSAVYTVYKYSLPTPGTEELFYLKVNVNTYARARTK